jgi:hypothetical protein
MKAQRIIFPPRLSDALFFARKPAKQAWLSHITRLPLGSVADYS